MATRAKSICRHPACGKLIDLPGHCEQHAKLIARQADVRRGSSHQRGYGRKWQKARADYLIEHPLCAECACNDIVNAATEVDHKIPHKLKEALDSGDPSAIANAQSLFWDRKNWQGLCKPHHSRKTAREDGGFGL